VKSLSTHADPIGEQDLGVLKDGASTRAAIDWFSLEQYVWSEAPASGANVQDECERIKLDMIVNLPASSRQVRGNI
jgi:hypothetical protein